MISEEVFENEKFIKFGDSNLSVTKEFYERLKTIIFDDESYPIDHPDQLRELKSYLNYFDQTKKWSKKCYDLIKEYLDKQSFLVH